MSPDLDVGQARKQMMIHSAIQWQVGSLVIAGFVVFAGCEVSDPAGDQDLEELRLELEDVPAFEATTLLLQEHGKILDWDALLVDDFGAVSIPVIEPGKERASHAEVLWVERVSGGTPIVYIIGGELADGEDINELSSDINKVPAPQCNYGAFAYSTSCTVATNTGNLCINGQPLYLRSSYNIDYYVNGRIRANQPSSTLYNCGWIPSSWGCSSACNVNPCAQYGNWEYCGIDTCCAWGSNCNLCI